MSHTIANCCVICSYKTFIRGKPKVYLIKSHIKKDRYFENQHVFEDTIHVKNNPNDGDDLNFRSN